jgi:formylglycine-generating enzyme required for sulfatase activity
MVESNKFRMLTDGWILDKVLGIEWGPSSSKTVSWEDAKKYAAEQGGRLPTIKELQSLVDYDRHSPAIDMQFFNDTKMDNWYWTSTEVDGYIAFAWNVSFNYGYTGSTIKSHYYYVRPVRANGGGNKLPTRRIK